MQRKRENFDFRQWAGRCLRCGLCTATCPVHQAEGDEFTAARGRNLLAISLGKDFDRDFRRRFEKCLLCGACLPRCPRGIPIDRLTLAVREEMARRKGVGLLKRSAFRWAAGDREKFGRMLGRIAGLQKYLRTGKGKVRHLPAFIAGIAAGRALPEIAPVFLRRILPEVSLPHGGDPRARVGFFMGCAMDFIFPETGRKIVRFLNRQGIEVVTPKGQGCCAMPVLGAGDGDTAQIMAAQNIAAFQGVSRVIVGCASCGSALKNYGTFFGSTEGAADFGRKVRDLAEFLVRELNLAPQVLAEAGTNGKPMTVTYHDPCHLARYQGITEEPRRLLSSLPQIKLREMEGADRCCGMGGSFGIVYHATSRKIGDQKAASIAATGAEAVITSCPGCRLQLSDALERNGGSQRVLHLIDLLEPEVMPNPT